MQASCDSSKRCPRLGNPGHCGLHVQRRDQCRARPNNVTNQSGGKFTGTRPRSHRQRPHVQHRAHSDSAREQQHHPETTTRRPHQAGDDRRLFQSRTQCNHVQPSL
uniref:Uncharacterized protein n=1 Tax=Cacopsylla melanoneura TaxID=428564 RepID=A0A8D8X4L4_9HEMI